MKIRCPFCGSMEHAPEGSNYLWVMERVEEEGCQSCRAARTFRFLLSEGAHGRNLALQILDFWARTGAAPQGDGWQEAVAEFKRTLN